MQCMSVCVCSEHADDSLAVRWINLAQFFFEKEKKQINKPTNGDICACIRIKSMTTPIKQRVPVYAFSFSRLFTVVTRSCWFFLLQLNTARLSLAKTLWLANQMYKNGNRNYESYLYFMHSLSIQICIVFVGSSFVFVR